MNPTPTSFVFTPFYSVAGVDGGIGSVVICFIPRILVGIVPYYVYKLALRLSGSETQKRGVSGVGLTLAGVCGALVNTLLVMNLIYLLFGEQYAAAGGQTLVHPPTGEKEQQAGLSGAVKKYLFHTGFRF